MEEREHTHDYKFNNGIFYCKSCGDFQEVNTPSNPNIPNFFCYKVKFCLVFF